MKICTSFFARSLFIFALVISLSDYAHSQSLNHVQGEILIELERDANPNLIVKKLEQGFRAPFEFKSEQVLAVPMNIWKIKFDFAQINEIDLLRYAKTINGVYNAQVNHLLEDRAIPNDAQFESQWQYINMGMDGGTVDADIDADLAWDIATGGLTSAGDTIVACVIDDGLDPTHDDFGDNVWINYNEIPDNGEDDDGNGYVDDYLGWDSYNDTDDIYQGGGHGTPVAGIVGAKGNNEIGVAGVNWDVKLMIVRGGGNEAEALAAYGYPYIMRKMYNETDGELGAFVVTTNASWGVNFGQPEDAPIWCNFYDSLGMVGILNCGATINDDVNVDIDGDLPTACSSDFLISVSNLDRTGQKVQFAGYGTETIDLGAFGADTWTAAIGNGYGGFGGTSGATPHVTGAIALAYSIPCDNLTSLYQSDPAGAALFLRDAILNGTKTFDEFEDLFATSGRLNLNNTLGLVLNSCGGCPFPLSVEVADIYLDTANIVWDNPDGIASFNLQYREAGEEEWTFVEGASSPFTISDLNLCSNYELQIQSACGPDSIGNFSFTKTFTTIGCCNNPDNPEANAATDMVPEGALFVEWEAEGDYESYILEYKFPEEEEWNEISTTESSLIVEGLGFCQLVQLRVMASCITGAMTTFSDTTFAVTSCGPCTTLPYCESPDLVTAGEWIESVTIDETFMPSGDDGGFKDNAGFYDVRIPMGEPFLFEVDKGFGDVTFSEWVTAWIDLNGDGEFTDDEIIYDEGDATEDDISVMLDLGTDFVPGFTQLRIGMVFIDPPVACNDDNLSTFGEFEEFCVELFFAQPCDVGLEIDTIGVGQGSAFIVFTEVDSSIAYNVRYKQVEESDEDWNTISVIDTTAMISDLEDCGTYVVQVRAVCPIDTSGFFATSDTFQVPGVGCMVNTFEFDDLPQVNISPSPNPFIDRLNLRIDSRLGAEAILEVYSIEGRRVFSKEIYMRAGSSDLEIYESSGWDAGIYMIKLGSKDLSTSIKVIKIGT